MTLLFWASFALVAYAYLGYPLSLWLLGKVKRRAVAKAPFEPEVSVVLAACNEEGNIVRRLENLLAQEYPADKLEVVLVSDGSRDGTARLASCFDPARVKLVRFAERQGKAMALNAGVARAGGEIVVFCDARQSFEEDAVRQLVANFRDPSVGCVSGELILHKTGSTGIQVEMGAYWHYEKWIRRAESASGSVVGATGAVYAIRRALYRELPCGTLLDDVMTPMRVVLQGFRTIFDPSARAHDLVSQEYAQEWVRKVRTLAGNWQLMSLEPALLLPWRNPCCWRFVCHKLLRLLVPAALPLLLLSGALVESGFYRSATLLQLACYAAALAGRLLPAARANRVVSLCYFFVTMNLAALAGFWLWATGRSAQLWQPAYLKGR